MRLALLWSGIIAHSYGRFWPGLCENSTHDISDFEENMSNSLTLIDALCPQHFENMAIALREATNEYFQYLFGLWNCSRTKFANNGQILLQDMYATVPR